MGSVPLHPAIVHVPLGLAVVIPWIALGLVIALWKGRVTRRAWGLAVALQAAVAAGGFVAMRTGESEEERVEEVVAEAPLERHEEAAALFTWSAVGALGVAVSVLVLPAPAVPAGALTATLAMLVVAGLGVRTGKAGGELVYRHNAAAAYAASAGGQPAPGAAREPGSGAEEDEAGDEDADRTAAAP